MVCKQRTCSLLFQLQNSCLQLVSMSSVQFRFPRLLALQGLHSSEKATTENRKIWKRLDLVSKIIGFMIFHSVDRESSNGEQVPTKHTHQLSVIIASLVSLISTNKLHECLLSRNPFLTSFHWSVEEIMRRKSHQENNFGIQFIRFYWKKPDCATMNWALLQTFSFLHFELGNTLIAWMNGVAFSLQWSWKVLNLSFFASAFLSSASLHFIWSLFCLHMNYCFFSWLSEHRCFYLGEVWHVVQSIQWVGKIGWHFFFKNRSSWHFHVLTNCFFFAFFSFLSLLSTPMNMSGFWFCFFCLWMFIQLGCAFPVWCLLCN